MNEVNETLKGLRARLGAATKRADEGRDFALKQIAETRAVEEKMRDTVNLAVIALKALEMVNGDEVIYFVHTHLRADLLALHPVLAERLR